MPSSSKRAAHVGRLAAAVALWTPGILTHGAAIALSLAVLVLAGQPLITDDMWFHLALGRAFLGEGPWLVEDPHLFTAAGPPATASWLADVLLYIAARPAGLSGLRILHVCLAAAILCLAWQCMQRAARSSRLASAGLCVFITLSTYRIAQLRPHLLTMIAMLMLYVLLLETRERPSALRLAAAAGLCGIWANLHGAFLLAPLFVGGAAATIALISRFQPPEERARATDRSFGLGVAFVLILVVTTFNPSGLDAHLAYFTTGADTLELSAVVDEWRPVGLFSAPPPNIPPSLSAWLMCWALVLSGFAIGFSTIRRWHRKQFADALDPAHAFLAAGGLIAMLFATRFLWLGVFGIIGGLAVMRCRSRDVDRKTLWMAALLSVALVPSFFWAGDWNMLSGNIRGSGTNYREPYPASKYFGHALWLLADSGIEGNCSNDYSVGGFMSFWLAPRIMVSTSGSMNSRRDFMIDSFAIARGPRLAQAAELTDLLDRHAVDLFLGTGLPLLPHSNRPNPYTTAHLEGMPGWTLIFRDLRSAIYLRRNERNEDNLRRIAAYYQENGVPFEAERGFDVEAVIVGATTWSIRHGIIPRDFERLVRAARESQRQAGRSPSLDRLSLVYLALGLYERSFEIEELIRRSSPSDALSARRILWLNLRMKRANEALSLEAQDLGDSTDPLTSTLIEITKQAGRDPSERDPLHIAQLPILTSAEAARVMTGVVQPLARDVPP